MFQRILGQQENNVLILRHGSTSSLENLRCDPQASNQETMRLAPLLMALAASFLVSTEALSATTETTQTKLAKVASTDAINQRLLRTNEGIDEYEDDTSEERGLSPEQLHKLRKYGKSLGIDMQRADRDTLYLQFHAKFPKYVAKMNKYIEKNKAKKGK